MQKQEQRLKKTVFYKPLQLVGSSIGAWRMACYAQSDSVAEIERFREFYVHLGEGLDERTKLSLKDRTEMTYGIVDSIMGENGRYVCEILSNPIYHLSVVSARCKGLLSS